MQKIVLASHNTGKIKEFQRLLAGLSIEIIPQSELGLTEANEPFPTFVENALAKARHASQATDLPVLADDSGLCVEALKGAPGVLSARYGGTPKSDANNNAMLLHTLKDQPNRRAYYYAVLVLVRYTDDPQPLIAEGRCDGEILTSPLGDGGFGYDPLFWVPSLGKSVAQLTAEEKSTISHRGQAVHALIAQLGIR